MGVLEYLILWLVQNYAIIELVRFILALENKIFI